MKAWWTAQELALQTLPGLPTTKRKINETADQLGWAGRTNAAGQPLSRPRKGKGGGMEYGRTDGATEAILAANPALAGLPPRLPAGLTILLPTIASSPVAATVRLWD